jgi:D-amino peptidase
MRLFLSVDMEGTTGLERAEELFRGLPGFVTFRQVMAGDANAVIQGAIAGGADEVVVADSHGYMCNLHPDDLIEGVTLKRGQLRREYGQLKGLDGSFDAVIMIGYHAKAGTANGLLAHTWGGGFRDVRVNGLSLPETSLNGLLAGAFGVPVIMVAGDDLAADQSRSVLGDIDYAVLKTSLARNRADHLPIGAARNLLRDTAKRAVACAKKREPVRCTLPVTVEVDLSPDPYRQPVRGSRPGDGLTFLDGPPPAGTKALSDVELVMRTHPELCSPKTGTVQFTCSDYPTAYKTLFSILADMYEREIENVIDTVADPTNYSRPELADLFGDHLLTEIPSRRAARRASSR